MGIADPGLMRVARSAGGYVPAQSIQFSAASSQRADITLTTSADWALSCWAKKTKNGVVLPILGTALYFNASDQLVCGSLTTTAVYRDVTAFYGIEVYGDHLYVNGEDMGACSTAALTDPSIAYDATNYFDGVIADFAFNNGSTASLGGGRSHSDVGWVPKAPTGATHVYADFTPVNVPTDSSDVPADDAGANLGNYARWNPLEGESLITYSLAGLKMLYSGVSDRNSARTTFKMPADTDCFCEFYVDAATGGGTDLAVGIEDGTAQSNNTAAIYNNGYMYREAGTFGDQGSFAAYGDAFVAGDVLGVWRKANGDLVFYKNGVSQGTAKTGLTGEFFFVATAYSGGSCTLRSEPDSWTQTPAGVSGSMALCTAHLPDESVTTPQTGSFTGNASADGPFVDLGFTPDQAGTCTINGNAITWGTHALPTAGGMKIITSSASYNTSGANTYSIAVSGTFAGPGVSQARAQFVA